MSAPLEPWERAWLDHRADWELEMVGQPGVFGSLCALDALDWDADATMAWLRESDQNRGDQ